MKGLLGFIKTSTSRHWLLLLPNFTLLSTHFSFHFSFYSSSFCFTNPFSSCCGIEWRSGRHVRRVCKSYQRVKGGRGMVFARGRETGKGASSLRGRRHLIYVAFGQFVLFPHFFLRFVLFWLCLFCCSLLAIRKFVSPADLNHNLINELPISNGKMQKNQFVIVVYEVAIHFF